MKKFLLTLFLTTVHYFLLSQGIIRGKVIERQTHEHLAGASIAIKGSSASTIANNDGTFLLHNVEPGKLTLIISYVGYEQAEMPVEVVDDSTSFVNVLMNVDARVSSTVVLTATQRRERIVNAPASISVFGVKDFEQFAGSNINELASRVNGLQFIRSGVDWISFNARNFNSGGNLKVLQLVDGRLNRAALSANTPIFNMGSYTKDDIERLEIVFGPQAALYGPNALNAVFNVTTKDPRKYQGTTVAVSAGNHFQFSSRVRHAEKINNKWAYKITGEYASGKEFIWYDTVYVTPYPPYGSTTKEHNVDFDFRHIRAEGQVYYSLTPKTDIIVSGGFGNSNLLQPGRVQIRDVTHGFYQARLVHPGYFFTISNTFGNIGKSYQITPYTRTFWNLTHKPNPLPPEVAEDSALVLNKEKSRRINADAQYNHTFQKAGLFLVAGLNYQMEKPNGFGINLLDSFRQIMIAQYGAVIQLEKSLPWDFRMIGAMRFDHHSNFGSFISPKLGLIKSFGDNSFRITWGKAYSTPNILSQYANINRSYFGNGAGIIYLPTGSKMNEVSENYRTTTPLKVEEIDSWEFGYKGTIAKKLFVDITSYYNKSNNFIGPNQSMGGRAISAFGQDLWPSNPGTEVNGILVGGSFSCNFNYGEVHNYGLDVDLNYSINNFINLKVQYSWFGSDITDDNINNDANRDEYVSLEERSLNSPRNKGMIGLNLQELLKKKLFINISTRLIQQYDFYSGLQIGTEAGKGSRGKVYWENKRGQSGYYLKNFDWGPLGGFISFDLNAGYKINQMVSINMAITNVLNSRQMEAVGSPSIGRLIMFELKINVPKNKE
jgi:outer membrane receptor for ferrienterochelin and colicins